MFLTRGQNTLVKAENNLGLFLISLLFSWCDCGSGEHNSQVRRRHFRWKGLSLVGLKKFDDWYLWAGMFGCFCFVCASMFTWVFEWETKIKHLEMGKRFPRCGLVDFVSFFRLESTVQMALSSPLHVETRCCCCRERFTLGSSQFLLVTIDHGCLH